MSETSPITCDGSGRCKAPAHIHGCFADRHGDCDNPDDHQFLAEAPVPVVNVSGEAPEKQRTERLAAEVSAILLHQYSEWLDGEGLIASDEGEGADKRTHDDLVAEFLASER